MLSLFAKPPILETERLILRKMAVSDHKDMFEYSARPETSRYLLWSPHPSPFYTKRYLTWLQGQYRGGKFYDFAVVEKESGKMLGTCGFTSFHIPNNSAEVGYVLNPDFHGKGYATEALTKLMEFGFRTLYLHRLVARIMVENIASRRVAEKCGFRHEATHIDEMLVKGEYRTIAEYAILSSEFRAARE